METLQPPIARMQSKKALPLLFLLATVATAAAWQSGDFSYMINASGDSVTITNYTGSGGEVTIPGTIASLPVTMIGYRAFLDADSMTGVTIPDSVVELEDEAFGACSILTRVAIGDGVVEIGGSAFWECTKLSDLTFGNSVSNIGGGAFSRCFDLANITLPDSVANIGSSAFNNCTSLGSVVIPENVATIGGSAFRLCQAMESITIGSGTTSIGSGAFGACTSLTNIAVDAANPAYSSSDGVFFNKDQTTLLQFPGGKTGSYTIPGSVATITPSAFSSCHLTDVTVPGSVATIGSYAFYSCSALTGTYFEGDAPDPGASGDYMFQYSNNVIVYYLAGTAGWGATYGGRPTALWLPADSIILEDPGVAANQFGFSINGASGQVVVVEASTALTNSAAWLPLQTNTLGNDPLFFGDPQWSSYPTRCYRVHTQ